MDRSNDPSGLGSAATLFIYSWIQHMCQAWGWRLRIPQALWNFNSLSPSKPRLLPPSLTCTEPPSMCSPKHSVFAGYKSYFTYLFLITFKAGTVSHLSLQTQGLAQSLSFCRYSITHTVSLYIHILIYSMKERVIEQEHN